MPVNPAEVRGKADGAAYVVADFQRGETGGKHAAHEQHDNDFGKQHRRDVPATTTDLADRVDLAAGLGEDATHPPLAEEAVQLALDSELEVTRQINQLMDLAASESDHAAQTFLQWFVSEQVEEEANALGIVERLKMIGDNSMGLLMIDQQLGQRTADGGADAAAQ